MAPSNRTAHYCHALDFAQGQVRHLIERHPGFFPMYTRDGNWKHTGEPWTDWCGGFLAGMMWLFYRGTGDRWWLEQAERYSRMLEPRQADRDVHDLGFIFLNSYRRWYETTGEEGRMDVVVQAGVTLAKRFQEKGQYLASFLGAHSLFIDIMMNVPLLFVAAEWLEKHGWPASQRSSAGIVDDPGTEAGRLRRVAIAHCRTSQRFLVRADGSSAHEGIFDIASGEFLHESTQQGLRPDSCWSRGLAWALYGFATVYQHTGNVQFLETATRCADYFLAHLPPEKVPYWDFDVPSGPDQVWDSSAAAIAASGLLQLAELTARDNRLPQPSPSRGEGAYSYNREAGKPETASVYRSAIRSPQSAISTDRYREAALDILDALCSDEFLAAATPGWEGILRHAVYHYHKRLGVDESVMWGDHFFVEALTKGGAMLSE